MLRTVDLATGYPARPPLHQHLNLRLPAGSLTCLLGRNGTGKSTLMRTLAGLQSPLAGQVCWGDEDLSRLSPTLRARRTAVVLSDRIQAIHLTVRQLLALGRAPYTGWRDRLRPEDHQAIHQALEATHITALADRPLSQLSDGQRQRAMIARALVQDTPVLLLDEPTAFLDYPSRKDMLLLLHSLAQHKAVLFSTHEVEQAIAVSDQAWILSQGQVWTGKATEAAPQIQQAFG